MFEPNSGTDPTLNQGRWLRRFFQRHNLDVLSHDFRTSQASRHFADGKNILKTSKLLGHSSVKTTETYLKTDQQEELGDMETYLMKQNNARQQREKEM